MPGNLELGIVVSASLGAALSAFESLKGTLGKVSGVVKSLNKDYKALEHEIKAIETLGITAPEHLARQYEKQGQAIDRLVAKQKNLARLQTRIGEEESKRGVLRGKMMETAALAYAAWRPVSIGVEFEYTMSKVQALTRLDKHSPEMKALNDQARELGAKTLFSASQAAEGQAYLAMAFLSSVPGNKCNSFSTIAKTRNPIYRGPLHQTRQTQPLHNLCRHAKTCPPLLRCPQKPYPLSG